MNRVIYLFFIFSLLLYCTAANPLLGIPSFGYHVSADNSSKMTRFNRALIFQAEQKGTAAIPPLPAPDRNHAQIAIAITKHRMTISEIKKLIQKYPQLQLRNQYCLALTGFSVQGSQAMLENLAGEKEVQQVALVNRYITGGQNSSGSISALSGSSSETAPTAGHFITNQYQVQAADNMELIGATKARGILDKRLTGKGVKIGIIDTGVDYKHRDLSRNFKGGRDIVDGDGDPMETKGAFGQVTLHGTHVAGIIAANGQMKGVAPEASIYAYRALGPGGYGTSEQILAAIEQAIKDKVDILNLSLGTNVNGPDLPLSIALNKAVDYGIVAVTSSGNSGPNDWTVGSPGTASKALSVGASTPTLHITYILDQDGERIRLESMQGSAPWELNREYRLINGGIGRPQELREARGKIVLLERGHLTFLEKVKNAAEAGAVAAIIFNNTQGPLLGNLEQISPIPIMGITKKEGKRLLRKMEAGDVRIKTAVLEEKDTLAPFSSRGPVTSTWEIKPDVLAPGVAIQSTVPGGYIPMQGTSMAAPHVAGAAALIKQAHPDWSPEQIKAALMNNAKPLRNSNGRLYRTYEQGAGRIQLEESLKAEVLAYPASLQFGRFRMNDRLHEHTAEIIIENISKEVKRISFSVPKHEPGIDWHIPLPLMLQPGEKKKVEIHLSAEPELLQNKIRDGLLLMHADSREIRIPYLFVLEEPDYPRVMGFDFGAGDMPGTFRYEVYLPGGADEFGIALFDPDTQRFVQFLDWKRHVGKGLLKQELTGEQLPDEGLYIGKVFARKSGKEDMLDTFLPIYKSLK